MFTTLWIILICICLYYAITHPLKQGAGISLLFVLAAVVPYVLGKLVYNLPMPQIHLFNSMAAFTVIAIIAWLEDSTLRDNIVYLSIAEVGLNIIGSESWYKYHYIHLSNYIFDNTGVSLVTVLGENWIYNTLLILFYLVAIYILYDKEDREQYVGNGVLQFVGDTVLSPNIRFKDMEECQEKQKNS